MKSKLNAIVLLACIALVFLLLVQSGYASDNNGWGLDGAWIMRVSNGLATLNHNLTLIAQDSNGLHHTAVMEHSECSATVFGMFPKATNQSDSIGVAVKTGLSTLDYTVVGQGIKKGELADEVVYISVLSGEMRLLGLDTMEGEATIAYYLANQDVDHDGFPDANEVPVICMPCTCTAQRVLLRPPSEFTLELPMPPADAPVYEVTIQGDWITDPFPDPEVHRKPFDATLKIGDKEYSCTGTDSQYNWTDSTETTKGGFRVLTFDFGELGVFELWERMDGEYKIIDMEGGHRYHEYKATGWIIRGTGAFINTAGIIQTTYGNDYTWDPVVGPSVLREEIHFSSNGTVKGVILPE
jgi:hypothetical protein